MKLKDVPIKGKIWEKHKRVTKFLWFITWIIFLPFVILQIIEEILEFVIQKFAKLRSDIVYMLFKIIYKKEILEDLKVRKE